MASCSPREWGAVGCFDRIAGANHGLRLLEETVSCALPAHLVSAFQQDRRGVTKRG